MSKVKMENSIKHWIFGIVGEQFLEFIAKVRLIKTYIIL